MSRYNTRGALAQPLLNAARELRNHDMWDILGNYCLENQQVCSQIEFWQKWFRFQYVAENDLSPRQAISDILSDIQDSYYDVVQEARQMQFWRDLQGLGSLEGCSQVVRDNITVSAYQGQAGVACGICLVDFERDEQVSRLNCGHIFHTECIAPWISAGIGRDPIYGRRGATCPLCRAEIAVEIVNNCVSLLTFLQKVMRPYEILRSLGDFDDLVMPEFCQSVIRFTNEMIDNPLQRYYHYYTLKTIFNALPAGLLRYDTVELFEDILEDEREGPKADLTNVQMARILAGEPNSTFLSNDRDTQSCNSVLLKIQEAMRAAGQEIRVVRVEFTQAEFSLQFVSLLFYTHLRYILGAQIEQEDEGAVIIRFDYNIHARDMLRLNVAMLR